MCRETEELSKSEPERSNSPEVQPSGVELQFNGTEITAQAATAPTSVDLRFSRKNRLEEAE